MKKTKMPSLILTGSLATLFFISSAALGSTLEQEAIIFPRSLDSYNDAQLGILAILKNRIALEPFNLVASLIFLGAIIHTFLVSKFISIANRWDRQHQKKIDRNEAPKLSVHYGARLFHFFGEVEVVFGLWVIPLVLSIIFFYDRSTWITYITHDVDFTDAMFVVTIMILASSRPILLLAESTMRFFSSLLGGSLAAWWLIILTIGPMLSSLITEPAAMTICALLLARKLYDLNPSDNFKYATIGLLFVNISVGGTLTNFAAPPVLMVAETWDWGTVHMLVHFGWKAVLAMVISNGIYFFIFRHELVRLEEEHQLRSLKEHIQRTFMRRVDMMMRFDKIGPLVTSETNLKEKVEYQIEKQMAEIKDQLKNSYMAEAAKQNTYPELMKEAFDQRFEDLKLLKIQEIAPGILPPEKRAPFVDPSWDQRDDNVPLWVTLIHVLFMGWVISNAHNPEIFIAGLLFFLGFTVVSSPFQNKINLIPPMLVGFFLGALVVHGGVQGWWIAPVLGNLSEIPLMGITTVMTAFNDNAAITYLSTLVPGFTDELKYAVMSGAVAGGGLTVIANAPNPAGQSILKKYFSEGFSAVRLLKASILPTTIVWFCFFIFR